MAARRELTIGGGRRTVMSWSGRAEEILTRGMDAVLAFPPSGCRGFDGSAPRRLQCSSLVPRARRGRWAGRGLRL